MPSDPVLVSAVRMWLAQAAQELATGEAEISKPSTFTEGIFFHPQQAVEKVLKAFLAWHVKPFRNAHNLLELASDCARIDPSLEGILKKVESLSDYPWKFRYAEQGNSPAEALAEEALTLAKAVFSGLVERLPAEVRP